MDYQNLKVNNKPLFSEQKTVWNKKPFDYTLDVHDGEVVEIVADIRRHHWTYKEIKELFHFNPLMFLSVFILAFFFSYQIVQYLAQYKILKHHSRIDIVFLVAFVILLFIPMSQISKETKDMRENRMLATFPTLIVNNTFNTNYTKQFENWFNDRFRGRDKLLHVYTKVEKANSIIKSDKGSYDQKTHWTFDQWQISHKPLSMQKDKEILSALQNLQKFLKENNIEFYVFVTPEKLDLYKNFDSLHKSDFWRQAESSINISTIDFLKKNATFPIIYPLEALQKASAENLVYFKTEHHWTEWGAYQGYAELIKEIQKKYPNIKIANEDEFDIFYNNKIRGDWGRGFGIGESFYLLNLGSGNINEKEVLDTPYKYYTPKTPAELKITDKKGYKTKHYKNKNSNNNLKVLITGTSMNENLMQFLPYSFHELIYYRLNSVIDVKVEDVYKLLKRYKKEILAFKPDVFILSIAAGNLPSLVNLTKE